MTITQASTTATRSPADLRCLVERFARGAEAPQQLDVIRPQSATASDGRAYTLLELTDDLEIWAIRWPSSQGLDLHDHGGSAGALWVISGELVEHVPSADDPTQLTRRHLPAGTGIGFDAAHVHAVRNERTAPATSIHAYSPPMHSMTFYERRPSGLVAERTDLRFDPTWTP